MKVSVIGTGYVGLVSGTCFAEIGHEVTCIDLDVEKIETLKQGKSPIYEPGLSELIVRNSASKRLHFSTDYASVKEAKCIFLAVGTPASENGEADLTYLFKAAESVAKELSDDAIVVIKSTVPVGSNAEVEKCIGNKTKKRFHLVNNPEFLKEGTAVEDFMRPDRVIIGHHDEYAAKVMKELYAPLVAQGNPIYMMSNLSAEMSKYAANAFLATKISFINEVAHLCDYTGADINEVRQGISSDKRIGSKFLYPGPGYGGSCFPKDVKALFHTAKKNGMDFKIVRATEEVNDAQKIRMLEKMLDYFAGSIEGRIFAFWGTAFKANTDDIRESAAIYLAEAIIKVGGRVHYFDPVAGDNFAKYMQGNSATKNQTQQFSNKYDCLNDCDGLVTMTEWREFRVPDFAEVKNRLKTAAIFDARNLYDTQKILDEGFAYFAIGKRISGNIK